MRPGHAVMSRPVSVCHNAYMQYDLIRLGPREFENLTQSLALRILGLGVSVFGAGPDGGREATFSGTADYPNPVPPTGKWNGYGVIQAKHRSVTNAEDSKWFVAEIKKEMSVWDNPTSNRREQGQIPDYLIFSTNVDLSAVPGRGGIDQANSTIETYAKKARDKRLVSLAWTADITLSRYL